MIGDLLRRNVQDRSTPILLPARSLTAQSVFGPINVTRDTLLSSVVANRCIALIADQIGSLPIHAERGNERITTPALLAAPEIDRTRSEFVSALVTSLLINGNAYLLAGRRDALGFPQTVMLLDPEAIQVAIVDGQPQYRTARGTLNPEDVLHIRNFTLPGHVVGYGPLDFSIPAVITRSRHARFLVCRRTSSACPRRTRKRIATFNRTQRFLCGSRCDRLPSKSKKPYPLCSLEGNGQCSTLMPCCGPRRSSDTRPTKSHYGPVL